MTVAAVRFPGIGAVSSSDPSNPRGGAGMTDQLVRRQRHKELAAEPGAGALVIVLGQVSRPRQRLKAFEGQFDLAEPARTPCLTLRPVRMALQFRQQIALSLATV